MNKFGMSLLFAFSAATGNPAFADESSKVIEESFQVLSGSEINVDTYKGSVKFESWDKKHVEVVVRIEPDSEVDYEYGKKTVKAAKVEMSNSASGVRISSNNEDIPCQWGLLSICSTKYPNFHYVIHAPANSNIVITDKKSKIDISRFDGNFDIHSYKGIVMASYLKGKIEIDSHKGDITINNITGALNVENYKGEVTAQNLILTNNSSFETYKGVVTLRLPSDKGTILNVDIGKRSEFACSFDECKAYGGTGKATISVNGGGTNVSLTTYKGSVKVQ